MLWLMKLCMWREARGEGFEGMRAVGHVIWNRCHSNLNQVVSVVMAPWQFSAMTAKNDPQLDRYPTPDDLAYLQCESLVNAITSGGDDDPTQGATHYFNPHLVLPNWAAQMTKTASIGNHDFYK